MKKLVFFACLTLAAIKSNAFVTPTILFKDKEASYSIQWNNQFAQINNLVPEIKINGVWTSANQFKSIKWQKKEGTRLSENNQKYTGKVDYLYLICEGNPFVDNLTIVFEIMEGRPFLVMNSSLQVAKNFKLGGVRLFNSNKENIVLTDEEKTQHLMNKTCNKTWFNFRLIS